MEALGFWFPAVAKGPGKQMCLESLRFSRAWIACLSLFQPKCLGRLEVSGKGSCSAWPLKLVSNPLPSKALLTLLKRAGSADIPGLKPQLPDDQLCDLSK